MISVYTPFHKKDTCFLKLAYESLCSNTFQDFEWVVVTNGQGVEADLSFLANDKRVIIKSSTQTNNIGFLKHLCVSFCTKDILAELDYDDELTPNALQEVINAFNDKEVQFVYSNSCEFHNDTWKPNAYSEYYGWRTRPFTYKGHELIEMISFPISSQMMRRIEWAPNHIRSFRKDAYNAIGGYNTSMQVGDDHDLCCRFYIQYGQNGFYHIDKCLYLYRIHTNTVRTHNAQIQRQTDQNYLKYSRDMAAKWAQDNNLRCVDLGGRFSCPKGYESVDRIDADVICDLNGKWNFEDSSVGVIRASHIFEHLKDSIHTMNECYRVLAPGGWLFIEVPSTDGRGAWCDPTHISFWNEASFRYYTNKQFAAYISPEYKGRFQLSRKCTWVPPEFKQENIPVVQADLICLKPPYSDRAPGEILI